jgi:predicted RecA/RadA family phage recombinase
MAKNRRFSGAPTTRTLPVLAGTVSGNPVIVGMLPGVALTDRDASGNATVQLDGAFDVSVTGAIASVGLPVYITSSTYALVVAPGAGIQLLGMLCSRRALVRALLRLKLLTMRSRSVRLRDGRGCGLRCVGSRQFGG